MDRGFTCVYMTAFQLFDTLAKHTFGKGKDMEQNMTDKHFDVLMNSIIQIVKDSDSKDDAVEKLQNLIKEQKN